MSNTRRTLWSFPSLVLLLIAVGLTLAGCDSDSDDPEENSTETSDPADTTGESPEDDTTDPSEGEDAGESDAGEGEEGEEGEDAGEGETPDDDVFEPPALAELEVSEGCQPLHPGVDCTLPYPSDFFRVVDDSQPSGHKVVIPEAAKMVKFNGQIFDFLEYFDVDGFSHHQPILAVLPGGVDPEQLVFHLDDPAPSIEPTNNTLLINADTGALVAHWAEVDPNTDDLDRQALIVRPYVRLENSTRYIVALQNLRSPGGEIIEPHPGFAHILYEQTDKAPQTAELAARYETDIFPVLEGLGIERYDVQLAWDFTTVSEASVAGDMLAIRDDALSRLQRNPPVVKINSAEPSDKSEIAIRIEGELTVPLYLTDDTVEGRIYRGEDGRPAYNGEVQVPFLMQIPNSALPSAEGFEPARIMQYGHGFFGLREEINYGFMRGYSDEQRYITAAVDWWGMAEPDLDHVQLQIGLDPSGIFNFTDRVHQAMVNFMALAAAIQGPLQQVEELQYFDALAYDPAQHYYYGISQGAILGGTLAALAPVPSKWALSVGGGPYSLLMSRSASFSDLFSILDGQLQDKLLVQKFLTFSQHVWDRIDPMTYGPWVLREPLAGSPEDRQVLMQIGIGDHSVNNLGSELQARAMGVPLMEPSPRKVYGLDEVTSPTFEAALVIVDFLLEQEPGLDAALPEEEEKNDVHEGVRRNTKIKEQLDAFFRPEGPIIHTCDGPCDPE